MAQAIAYLRVSTVRQGASGLGLEAQKAAVDAFAAAHGYDIVAEYVEVESGKRNDRPELAKALAAAKRRKATLLIAKLDRLARNVFFIAGLLEANTSFKAVDMPEADRLMLQVYSAFAEAEARAISKRTSDALKAAKARGVRLGSARRDFDPEWRERGATANSRAAFEAYATVLPVIRDLHDEGESLASIAATLNARGFVTRTGAAWRAPQVQRVLARAEAVA